LFEKSVVRSISKNGYSNFEAIKLIGGMNKLTVRKLYVALHCCSVPLNILGILIEKLESPKGLVMR